MKTCIVHVLLAYYNYAFLYMYGSKFLWHGSKCTCATYTSKFLSTFGAIFTKNNTLHGCLSSMEYEYNYV